VWHQLLQPCHVCCPVTQVDALGGT
jgi:hypothetical protein